MEWVELIRQAKKDGLSVEDLQEFFGNKEYFLEEFRRIQDEYNKVSG
jgi:hypothetical protein